MKQISMIITLSIEMPLEIRELKTAVVFFFFFNSLLYSHLSQSTSDTDKCHFCLLLSGTLFFQ